MFDTQQHDGFHTAGSIKFTDLPICPHGMECKIISMDPSHARAMRHIPRPECPYGTTCQLLQTNVEHGLQFAHTGSLQGSVAFGGPKKLCPYDSDSCKLLVDGNHAKEFKHLNPCPYGVTCKLMRDESHTDSYSHLNNVQSAVQEPVNLGGTFPVAPLQSCPLGDSCKLQSDPSHTAKYKHLKSCPMGASCQFVLIGDTDHTSKYAHAPSLQSPMAMTGGYHHTQPTGPPGGYPLPGGPPIGYPPPGGPPGKHPHAQPHQGQPLSLCPDAWNCPETSNPTHKQQYMHYCRHGNGCRNKEEPKHQSRFLHY